MRLATALDGPLLMVDDLQWADPTSLRLLATLHARVPGLRLLLAYRSDEVPPSSAVAEFLRRTVEGPPVELGPLIAVGHRTADARPRARGRTRTAHRSDPPRVDGGRPRAGRHRRHHAGWAGQVAGGGPVGRARGGRSRCPESAPRDLRAGREDSRGFLDRSSRCSPFSGVRHPLGCSPPPPRVDEREVLESLGTLADADLVRQRQQGWGLVHDALGEVLVSELTTADRVQWQARLAAALDSAHGDVAERARLWREAGDRERAATAYAEAAAPCRRELRRRRGRAAGDGRLGAGRPIEGAGGGAVHAPREREVWPGSTRETSRAPEAISQTRSGMPGPGPAGRSCWRSWPR